MTDSTSAPDRSPRPGVARAAARNDKTPFGAAAPRTASSVVGEAEMGERVQLVAGVGAVPAAAWDACAAGAGDDNPFVRHAFLAALEDSGAVGAETGWVPCHALLLTPEGPSPNPSLGPTPGPTGRSAADPAAVPMRLRACAPLYLKGHSYGEYVFDWGWARAYEAAGGRYYPKLQAAVPFTPVTGPRLMVRADDPDPEGARRALLTGMLDQAARLGVSGLHITFLREDEATTATDLGLVRRMGLQYHWDNPGYASFDDFLAGLTSRKRKSLRKERDRAAARGVRFRVLTGGDLTPAWWDTFYGFYRDTIDRKWGAPYLTPTFFHRLGATMADRVALVVGEETATGRPVCGALNLIGAEALYGRVWGADPGYRDLHFEACYYQAMDLAIARGLRRVEAGAQGEHKISRGYRPQPTWSVHALRDPALAEAVADFLARETRALEDDREMLEALTPFRCESQDR